MATIDEIPFEVFTIAILPYLSTVDVGFLIQVNRMWKEFANDSMVWKYLYLRHTPAKILDTSIHIGRKSSRMRDHQKEYDVWRATRKSTIIYQGGYPFVPESTKRCTNSDWFLNHSWSCDCIPKEIKSTLKSWREVRTDGIDTDNFPIIPGYGNFRDTGDYCTYVNTQWVDYNRNKGLSTINLCQNPDHYAIDTLGTLEDCKKKKSFKKATLKILEKKSKAELAKATREKKSKLKKLEKARLIMQQLELQYLEAEQKEKKASVNLKTIQDAISLA